MTQIKKTAKPSRKTSPAASPSKKQSKPSLDINVIKTANCTNLRGQTGLTYEVGKCPIGSIHFRVSHNAGGGFFSPEWIRWESIYDACISAIPLTSMALKPLYVGKSANSAGFLLAVLVAEGLAVKQEGKIRQYQLTPLAKRKTKHTKASSSDAVTEISDTSPADTENRSKATDA